MKVIRYCLYFIHLKKEDTFMVIIRLHQTSHSDSLFFFIFVEYCACWVWTRWLASFRISPSFIIKNWLRLLSWVKQVPPWLGLYNLFNYFMSTWSICETYKPPIHNLSKKTDTELTTILYIRLEVNILFSSWW